MQDIHEKYIRLAFSLAQKGGKAVPPNPQVGCVIVHDQRIIGKGFHQIAGGEHAEINALNSVAQDEKYLLSKSTMYVSLEPCNFTGRTGPCSLAVIEAKIPKVVISAIDPHPLVNHSGIERMQHAGIEVISGVLEDNGLRLIHPFRVFQDYKRSYCILKYALSKEGIFAPYDGQKWLSSPEAKVKVHQWRSEAHAIVIGSGTALADDPQLNVRLVTGDNPVRVVIDRRNILPNNLKVFDGSQRTLVFSYPSKKIRIADNVEHICVNPEHFSIGHILEILFIKRLYYVLVEGGAEIINASYEEDVWDECRVFRTKTSLDSGKKVNIPFHPAILEEEIGSDLLAVYHNEKRQLKTYSS